MAESPNKELKETISNEQNSNGANIIDSLPDDVHIKILSLLPTLDAYRTSFVSTRWRRLWGAIPVIKLTADIIDPKHNFVQVVSHLLSLHDKESTLRSLCIGGRFYTPEFAGAVDSWINNANDLKTEELSLCIIPMQVTEESSFYNSPGRLFECKYLRKLVLCWCKLNFHGPVKLPSLQILSLSNVVLDSAVVEAVIAGTPRLKRLLFLQYEVHGELTIDNSNSHLSHLVVYPRLNDEGKIVIRLLELAEFVMHSMPSKGVSVAGSPNLLVVWLRFQEMLYYIYDLEDRHWHSNLVKLLSDLSHACSLHLCSWSLQVFTIWGRENLGPSRVVHWENLVLDLSITIWETPGLVYLLKTFSPVKNLTINFVRDEMIAEILIDAPEFDENEFLRIEGLPLASLQHLETISLSGLIRDEDVVGETPDEMAVNEFLERRENEIMLVKILLENSKALKQMTCICRLNRYLDRRELYSKLAEALSQKVQAFSRASPAAEVILSYE